ncbi:uncharacterized protein MYCGRDRAFT_48544, partial [Zymoseptoria tritici IPO323]
EAIRYLFGNMRALTDLVIRHFSLVRGDNTRNADLVDLTGYPLPNEGPYDCVILVFGLARTKV